MLPTVLLMENCYRRNFQNIWIQPASGDAGGLLVRLFNYMTFKNERFVDEKSDSMQGGFLGPSFNYGEIKNELDKSGANYQIYSQDEMIINTARELTRVRQLVGCKEKWNLAQDHLVREVY